MKRLTNICIPKKIPGSYNPYTIAFVYSPIGNYCIKGYYCDVDHYMSHFPKYIVRYTYWKNGHSHGWWSCSRDISIQLPYNRVNWDYHTGNCTKIVEKKYTITIGKKLWKFRRMPHSWIFGD